MPIKLIGSAKLCAADLLTEVDGSEKIRKAGVSGVRYNSMK
jgi:hypothetical protein